MMQLLNQQKSQVLLLLLCSMLFILVIKPWQLYFLNDDFLHIPMPNKWLFLRGGFMRPIPNFVLLFDKWLYGKNATGFFYTTIFFHTCCVISVYFFVKQLLVTYFSNSSFSFIPLITALLFLCYPYHAEPLMWVISRVSIMAAMLTFLSLTCYIKAGENYWYLLLSWLCFVTALFTYESMWNILLLFGLIGYADWQKQRTIFRKVLLMFGLMAATFGVYLLLRLWVLHSLAGDGYLEINENLSNFKLLVINQVKLSGRIFTPPFVNTIYAITFFAVSLIFYSWLIYKIFKRNKNWGWLMLLVWGAMITGVLTAAPLGIDTHYNESERYLYYASFFYCFFIAFAIAVLLNEKKRVVILGLLLLVFVLLFSDLQANYRYASTVTKTTVKMVAANTEYRNAYFIDVPMKYKGSMIFRISLPEAIRWIVPEATYDSVSIVSQIEMPSGILPFKTGACSWQELATAKGWNEKVPVIKGTGIMDRIENNDVVFWYRSDGLYKVLLP